MNAHSVATGEEFATVLKPELERLSGERFIEVTQRCVRLPTCVARLTWNAERKRNYNCSHHHCFLYCVLCATRATRGTG